MSLTVAGAVGGIGDQRTGKGSDRGKDILVSARTQGKGITTGRRTMTENWTP